MKRFKILKNDQGVYRLQIQEGDRYRVLMDTDFLDAIVSSHVSKPVNYYSEAAAHEGISNYLKREQFNKDLAESLKKKSQAPVVSDTFKDIDEE